MNENDLILCRLTKKQYYMYARQNKTAMIVSVYNLETTHLQTNVDNG